MRRLWALEKDNMISPIAYMYNAIFFPFSFFFFWGGAGLYFILFFFPFLSFLAMLRGLWDLSSPTRDRTRALAVKAQSPNHWTARNSLCYLLHNFVGNMKDALERLVRNNT